MPPAASDEPVILSVSDLTEVLRGVVEQCFPDVWVAGEISNCVRAGSGHVYFTLKDADAQLKGVMWRTAAQRLKFDVRDGLQVVANGSLEVYPPRGQYQIICQQLIPQGVGSLELALRQLQEKLTAEGLLSAERKRPLPAIPRRVALITSAQGAAVRDMIQVLSRRWPLSDIVILPVMVQGDGAAQQIARALGQVHRIPRVDVVICGRGGGSLEDLWAFNEEPVARAIAACQIPVVSAVGHEIDVTIADLVADRRALTPSEAAELVVPDQQEIRGHLAQLRQRLTRGLQQQASRARLQLDNLRQRRPFARPLDRIHDQQTRLDELDQRLTRAIKSVAQQCRQQLESAAAQLDALSPLAVLGRGFTLTKRLSDGALVRSARELRVGERVSTLLVDGEISCEVLQVRQEEDA